MDDPYQLHDVRFPQVSEGASTLSLPAGDPVPRSSAGLIFLSFSSCGVGASSASCPGLQQLDTLVNCCVRFARRESVSRCNYLACDKYKLTINERDTEANALRADRGSSECKIENGGGALPHGPSGWRGCTSTPGGSGQH